MCDQHKNNFWEGVTAGAILGVAAYVFLGSDEGKKFTKDFKKKAAPYLEDLAEVLEQWKDENESLLEKAEAVKDTIEEHLEETKGQVGPAVAAKLEGSLSHIEELQERGREATATIRKRFFKNVKKPIN
ncbi:YtxH domain-containing protein [Candidatus Gottesmanbacteria bacterium]|nr:YtxH domain-containing protein [Candidatus Gottesmanbacteria bacterium]